MSGPYQDILKDSSQSFEDGNYFLVTILDLDLGTQYPLEFRWKYKDGTFGKDWSAVRYIYTPGGTVPEEPQLLVTDVTAEPGIIKVTWSGKGASNQNLENIDRVNVHIAGVSFGDGTQPAGFFKEAGTQTFSAEAGTYFVQLKSVTVNGVGSFFSESRTVVVPAIEEPIEAPVTPTGFSARPVLSGIEVTWNGSYSGGASWLGFEAVNIYAGTTAAATSGTYIKVGQMTANKVENKIVIPIDGTYVRYDNIAYIHASASNRAIPPVESSISANVASATPSQVVNTDLINEVVTATKIATGAITEVKIDNNAITAAKIATGAITETKIATDAVTAPKIAAGAIEAGKIAAGAITAEKIAANAIEADKIAANAVTAGKILAGAVTTAKLDALAITSDKIAANAIIAGKIDTNAITADLINSGTLKATTYIRVGTKNFTTGAGGRIEISGSAVEDGNFDIPAGLYIYNSAGTAVLSAPLGGGLSVTGSLAATSISTSSGRFTVSSTGVMTAQDASFSGTITANGGSIGGIRIFASSIQNNTDEAASTFKLDNAGKARFGATSGNSLVLNPVSGSTSNIIYHSTDGGATASGNFSVTAGGILTAVGGNFSGTITNGTDYWNSNNTFRLGGANGINKASSTSNAITIGSDVTISGDLTAKSINIDTNNYWNNTGNAGKFKVGSTTKYVYWDGSTIDINGKVTADSGQIGPWVINSAGYLSDSGGTVRLLPSGTIGSQTYTLLTNKALLANSISLGSITETGGPNTGEMYIAGSSAPSGWALNVSGSSQLGSWTQIYNDGYISFRGGSISINGSLSFGVPANGLFEFLNSSGNVRVASTYSNSVSGRTMIISSTGLFGTSVSTMRKKHEIQNYSINEDALLSLELKTFKYKPEYDEFQEDQYGFIAEEAEALGLTELVQYDKDGLVDYFDYSRLPVFLFQIIKSQRQRINSIEARLDALEG